MKENNTVGPYLVWLDLEMTGLNPDRDVILEIASIVTDLELNEIACGPELVIHHGPFIHDMMDDWNIKQHTKTGLLEKVAQSKVFTHDAQQQTIDFIKKTCGDRLVTFAGNSIYQDRAFLRRYMPQLDACAQYRLVDVSSFKVMIRGWYKDDKMAIFEKKKAHRALDDIRESIEELQYYRKHFFKNTAS